MTRGEMLERITHDELLHWAALEQLEPWGERGANKRAALIAMTIASQWRSKEDPPLTLEDFELDFIGDRRKAAEKPQTVEEQRAVLFAYKARNDVKAN